MAAVDIGGTDSLNSEPNVVPLCDILLVLLIIFMVITPSLTKEGNVILPEAAYTADQPKPGEMITVSIEGNEAIRFEGIVIEDMTKLPALILDKIEKDQPKDKIKILLKAHKDVVYGRVIDVMNEIKKAEIEVIGLLVEKTAK